MVARLGFAANEFERRLASLRAVRVVSARPVIPRAGLERQRARAVVAPSTRFLRATQRRLHDFGLHVDEHRARDGRGARVEGVSVFGSVVLGCARRRRVPPASSLRRAEERLVDLIARRRGGRVRLARERGEELGAHLGEREAGTAFGSEQPRSFLGRVPTRRIRGRGRVETRGAETRRAPGYRIARAARSPPTPASRVSSAVPNGRQPRARAKWRDSFKWRV
jgi:hypothetical protein